VWEVKCPKCKRPHHEQLDGVVYEFNPKFKCKFCDWKGPLLVNNPNPGGIEPSSLFEYFLTKHSG
jgi:hypothetical protein